MDEAVQDGVGVSRIADELMPVFNRNLAGDDRRAPAIPVFQDLQEIMTAPGPRIGRELIKLVV